METKIRLAIADDHEIVRKGVMEIISSFGGFSIEIEACNGKELFDKLSAAEHLPDIVVMDISMPVWDGYETLENIRKKWNRQKILILTMHKHELAIIRMFRSGANGYLLKNCRPQQLQSALHSIFENGLYFSEVTSSNLYSRLQHSNILPELSEKEIQILKFCHTDLTYHEIAARLCVSERTVSGYKTNLFEKFGVNSRAGLVVCGLQMGLIPVD